MNIKILHKQLAIIVGNGKNIKFWSDHWIGDGPLNLKFPRIFSLAVDKDARIVDLRILDDSEWRWSIRLRRNLFNWETEQWDNLQDCIRDIVVNENFPDKVIWMFNSSGNFSVSYFGKS
ncbi:hypothetical protein COLO4_36939 [Corchorus olitorius]|uniref:Reverse transcriptase zinc-binding domain-containing protein n=1 Tax=Corchorus olitorius TaxID=93759 RepID=A0A1R3G454_9ROSI|nr:hypothetical protein COLO4_36939 [Corchorus olitorius]